MNLVVYSDEIRERAARNTTGSIRDLRDDIQHGRNRDKKNCYIILIK